jgi:cytochrome c oxidase subunit 2
MDYPGAQQLFSYNEMVVPTDTTVVPEDRGLRRDPLLVDPEVRPEGRRRARARERHWFKVPAGREGVYRGQCAELCGPNHADMRAMGAGREAG